MSAPLTDIPLHTRETVEPTPANVTIHRYRVAGGWLYHATSYNAATGTLAFVPDLPEHTP